MEDDTDKYPANFIRHIIEQDVARVNHAMDSKGLVEIGRDLEKTVLARAVKLHIRNRVLPNGPRTVVFA